MTDPGRANHARQLLEMTACWSASQLQEEWKPATPVLSRTVHRILACNSLHGCIAAQKPALNKTQLRNCVVYAKAHSLTESWTVTVYTRMVRKGVRAQMHNAGKTRFIKYTINTSHKTQQKGKINWWATPLVGQPSGRPPLWWASPLVGHPSGRLPLW